MTIPSDYKRRIIEHLRSGQASDGVWDEVGDALVAESELCGALALDVELGLARKCGCGDKVG